MVTGSRRTRGKRHLKRAIFNRRFNDGSQADAGLGSGNLNFAIDRAANHVKIGHQADVGQRPDGIIDKRTGTIQA